MSRFAVGAVYALALVAGCAGSRISGGDGDGGDIEPTDSGRTVDARMADRMLTPEDVDAAVAVDSSVPVDGAMADAAPVGPCNLAMPFGPPVAMTAINSTTAIDSAPTFSPDGLTLYFATTRTAGQAYDIWAATRGSVTAVFAGAAVVPNINSTSNDFGVTLTPDRLTAYFISERPDGGALGLGDVWKATRGTPTGTFNLPALLGDVSTSAAETDPWLSADGSQLMFASDRPGSDMLDFWIAPFNAGAGTFGGATRVTELNSLQREFGGSLTTDGLTVAITSNRTGAQGFDLYLATRASKTVGFGMPQSLTLLNSPQNDLGAALSPNGCELVFSSNRGASQDLHLATRPTGP